jgi:hypothetical protein
MEQLQFIMLVEVVVVNTVDLLIRQLQQLVVAV